MTVPIEVFDLHALNLLWELEQLKVVRFVAGPNHEPDPKSPEPEAKEFTSTKLGLF